MKAEVISKLGDVSVDVDVCYIVRISIFFTCGKSRQVLERWELLLLLLGWGGDWSEVVQ